VLRQEVVEHKGHRMHRFGVRFLSTGEEAVLYVNLDLAPPNMKVDPEQRGQQE